MIWNPWWASISMDNPALPYLKEIVNLVNVDSLVTTVFTADEDEKNVGLHSKCHTVFTPKEGQLDEYLKAMLDHFFGVMTERMLNAFNNASVEQLDQYVDIYKYIYIL